MTTPSGYIRNGCFSALARLLMLALLIVLTHATLQAQSDYGSTPLGNAPGAPAGSYALSGIDNINLFNGHVSVGIPLVGGGGRGGAKSQMTWVDSSPVPHHVAMDFDGWSLHYWDEWTLTPREVSLGMPVVKGVQSGWERYVCGGGDWHVFLKTLTRLSYVEPDGTEHELRDTAAGGQPLATTSCNPMYQGSRGRIFVTVDGTGVTFIADNPIIDHAEADYGYLEIYPTGYLLLKDGTRYYIDIYRGVTQRDRNGNIITMPYWNGLYGNQIKDSLNRVTTRQFASGTQCTSLAPNAANYCDQIVYKGSGGAVRALTIPYDSSSNEAIGIWLPNGQSYRFYYDTYGDLTRIDLPAGGSIEYTYGPGLTGQQPSFPLIQGAVPGTYEGGPSDGVGFVVYRRVEERRVYNEGHVLESRQTFSKPEDVSGSNLGYVEKKQYDANTNLLFSEKHYFYGSAKASFNLDGISYPAWKDGREYHTEFYDQNGNLLRQSDQTWEQRAPVSWWTGSPDAAPQNDARISLTWSRLENGLTSATSYAYDSTVPYNSLTDVYEYDYGACCVPGPFLRRTQTTYLKTLNGVDYTGSNITDPSAPYLRDFPLQTSVFDPWNIERARTTFEYDNYSVDSNHAALVPRASISGLDTASTTTYLTRGNVTGTTRYLLTNGSVTGSISAYAQYDVAGNVVKAIDPLGYTTMFYFTDCFGTPDGNARINAGAQELNSVGQYSYAFVTSATKAGQTVYSQFDFYSGPAVDVEDANGVVSSGYSENDPLDRPTKIIGNANQSSSFKSQTLFTYDDANRTITTTSDFATYGDGVLVSKVFYDVFGRSTEARQYEGGTNYIAAQTQYDALGRPFKVSNPFRPLPPYNETAVWTTSAFDALGRVISVTTPDGSMATSSYSGNTVTVTDQNGKQRKSMSDALGRVTQVYEDPAGLNYLTSYSYDVLNDLVTVNQGSQTRTFAYDSLKRLLSAANPENGTVSYQYDNNGNLLVKTDARGVSSHYDYDILGRPTRRWYNGSSSPSATTNNSPALPSGVGVSDEVKYFYDSQNLPVGAPSYSPGPSVGRLVAVAYGSNSSAGDYYGYDAIGRNVLKIQQTGGINYQVSAAYNVGGALTSETYPSGRAVTYTFDGAGRTSSVTGNLGDGTNRTYSTGIIYSSLGGMAKEQFGTNTPIYNKLFYNSRGQLSEIRESTSYTGPGDTNWNRGAIINHYSFQCWGACNGTDNNGNLKKQEVYVPDNDQVTSYKTWYQQYAYDSLNRLTQVNEYTGNPSLDWQQKYTIDRYGNRTIDVNNTSTNIPRPAFNVDASTNRLTVPSGQSGTMSYDSAGNLTTDSYTGSGSRTYDAENRMTGAQGSGYSNSYVYDGDGERMRRLAAGTETWQVYGLGGELLAEYAANAAPSAPQREYGYRNGQLLIMAECSARANVASASAGATATAQNYTQDGVYPGLHFQPSYANDGTRYITPNGDHYWRDEHGLSSWLQIDFNGSKSIDEVDVFTTADYPAYLTQADPSPTQTCTSWGLTAFDVQYWNGSAWSTVSGGSVSGNSLVWKKINFAAVTTSKIRVVANAAVDGVARIAEVEAWGNVTSVNAALASNGGVASASSTTPDTDFPGMEFHASSVNDGNRSGNTYPHNSFWRDGTNDAWPDWVQVDFNGSKTISEIDVFSVQDTIDASGPQNPTETMTFTLHGITDFDVQYWNGSSWATVSGGSVTGNNKVWKKITFSSVTTSKIRVTVNNALNHSSRVVELEAWTAASSSTANIHWLVTDQLGTPRMIFDQSGSLANVSRHDYLPFGEELYVNQGLRSAAQGYSINDNVRQHFTGYERDGESGLDYAHARYYASVQGRFTGVDQIGGSIGNPQSFNRYAYALNSPVNITDPTGLVASAQYASSGASDPYFDAFNKRAQWESEIGNGLAAHNQRLQDTYNTIAANAAAAAGNMNRFWEIVNGNENLSAVDGNGNEVQQADNTIAVTAARIEPVGIEGRISGVNQDAVNFSAPSSSGIFAEGAKFDVTLTLRLPKNTTDLEETFPEEIPGRKGEHPGGERNVVVHGSSVDSGTNNSFQFVTRYENAIMGKGKVSFSGVDYKAGIATARFGLSTKIYDPHASNTLLVNLVGQTKHHYLNTTIKVTIVPRAF